MYVDIGKIILQFTRKTILGRCEGACNIERPNRHVGCSVTEVESLETQLVINGKTTTGPKITNVITKTCKCQLYFDCPTSLTSQIWS